VRTRLTLPMKFANEKRALGVIRDNSLFTIGAQAVAVDDTGLGWRVIIDTSKTDAVCRYLSQSMLGVEWARSETP